MSDDLHRVIVRWEGSSRHGLVKVGEAEFHLHRLPSAIGKFFDLWYVPSSHHLEVRERESDPKRELTTEELGRIALFVRSVGALCRPIQDLFL